MFSIITWTLFLWISLSSPCTPKYLLPQIIHDSVTINSFNTSNANSNAIYAYNYFEKLFSSQTKIILSINELVCSKFTQLNYQISGQILPNHLNFNFNSKNMAWTSITIQFLLHSRNDIYSQIQTISILNTQQNTAVQYPIAKANAGSSYLVAHFIIGVIAMASSNYQIYVRPFSVANSRYQIIASSNAQAALSIQTIYVQSQSAAFSYAFNEFSFSYQNNPQYYALWADFTPHVYTLFGFSRVNIKGAAFEVKSSFDISDSLFTVSMGGTQSIFLAYFTIGQLPSNVCSPCNNYISFEGCLDACPNNSYPELLQSGKVCRKCNSLQGQMISSSNTCICPNNQIFLKGNCYNANELPKSCNTNELLINNKCLNINRKCAQSQLFDEHTQTCICKPNYQRFQGQCVSVCPAHSNRDNKGICICSSGFLMNAYQKCQSICTKNSYYDLKALKCFCNSGFEMKKGVCVACQSNEAYDSASKSCVARSVVRVGLTNSVVTITCQPNEVISNGVCVCNEESILVNNRCVKCHAKTYKLNSRQCRQCVDYCSTCKNGDSCEECDEGFQVDGSNCAEICGDGKKFILPCDDGNVNDDDGCSSTCQIQTGFVCNGGNKNHPDVCKRLTNNAKLSIMIAPKSPTYIAGAIITDFIINPPIQRSRDELYQLFNISFSKQKGKPKQIIISQSSIDYRSIRCFFDYYNNLPNGVFKASFGVEDKKYGKSTISLMYNTLSNPIQSAISYLNERQQEDILE